ncbi:protein shisa-4 isoform X1 [Myotis myotis]|uniref:protein shisa-4 isoform X1 n=1 Tax=Myotis myotis TaxID=51298 RepID=UPI00174EA267|nr:protein shisa-4 isoform X1 [Myotis myotis]
MPLTAIALLLLGAPLGKGQGARSGVPEPLGVLAGSRRERMESTPWKPTPEPQGELVLPAPVGWGPHSAGQHRLPGVPGRGRLMAPGLQLRAPHLLLWHLPPALLLRGPEPAPVRVPAEALPGLQVGAPRAVPSPRRPLGPDLPPAASTSRSGPVEGAGVCAHRRPRPGRSCDQEARRPPAGCLGRGSPEKMQVPQLMSPGFFPKDRA